MFMIEKLQTWASLPKGYDIKPSMYKGNWTMSIKDRNRKGSSSKLRKQYGQNLYGSRSVSNSKALGSVRDAVA